jgi:Tol biopolymer transport system component
MALSPDSQQIVYEAVTEDRSQLWLRSLVTGLSRPLAQTDGAIYPFWSPNGRSIGFFADAKLKKIDIDSGSIQTLADAPDSRGGSWGRDDTIIFSPSGNSGGMLRVSATSGDSPSPATHLQARQTNHRFPHFLPDGRHFLYYAQGGSAETSGIFVGDLDSSKTSRLLDANSAAVYVSSGHLLFVRESALFALNFDPSTLTLSGTAFQVAESVALSGRAQGGVALSASAAGPFVFRPASAAGLRQLTWFDRSAKELGKAYDELTSGVSPDLSADGRRVAVMRAEDGNFDIWILDLDRRRFSRLTTEPTVENQPAWHPEGTKIVYGSNRNGVFDLYVRPAAGGTETLLLATANSKDQMDWSPDGEFVLFRSLVDPKANSYDIWAVRVKDQKAFPVVETSANERDGQFSPDGKWIAYQSNRSGRWEIYVQPFPGTGGEVPISTNGGAQPRWRSRDGNELFYIALDGRLMAVRIRLSADGKTVEASQPERLFPTHIGGAVPPTFHPQQYAVSADGQRFLMNNVIEAATPITIVLNWKAKP